MLKNCLTGPLLKTMKALSYLVKLKMIRHKNGCYFLKNEHFNEMTKWPIASVCINTLYTYVFDTIKLYIVHIYGCQVIIFKKYCTGLDKQKNSA